MKSKITYLSLLLLPALYACDGNGDKADGYGNFEATEVTVSAEASGRILQFNVEEGQQIKQGASLGYVDTIQLHLKKEQLLASRKIVYARSQSVLSQIKVYEAQEKTLATDRQRIVNLMKDNAATQKQLDDVTGQQDVLHQQINSIKAQNTSVLEELKSLDAQISQIDDQIRKSIITSPVGGTVLVKYAEKGEVAAFGKPLFKIADLSEMILRVYVAEPQLASIQTGQKVKIKIDDQQEMKEMEGTIEWISSSAEFTPKVIQTKEERVNLVYATKIRVPNDGALKIGMPGEMWLGEKIQP